jgi:phosphatidate cytidylyltransferase
MLDVKTLSLVGGVLALLAAATTIGQRLKLQSDMGLNPAVVESFNLRIRAWWLMCTVLAAAFLLGSTTTVVLFGLISFWALREFITLTPTRLGDHRTLFWVFFLFTPLQYVLVGMGVQYYGLFSVLIPVYAFLFIPARVAMAGDYKRFLERTAKIQAGLMVCIDRKSTRLNSSHP